MIHTKVTNRDPLEFITLKDAKRQLNMDYTEHDDVYINDVTNTAMNLAEKATNRLLAKGTVNLSMKGVTSLYLPYGEIESLTSVKRGDDDIPHSFNSITQVLTLTKGAVTDDDEITVIYDAGYNTPANVPHAVKMGTKRLISSLYENREDDVVNASVSNIPLNALQLFNAYKLDNI